MRFVLASRNRHKLDEYRAILSPHEVEPMPAGIELPPEGVTSFDDNARAKAEALARALGGNDGRTVVVADDSGLEVDALGGAPGVISARYAGRDGDDQANNRRLLTELAALPGEHDRAARFVCVIAFVAPGGADATLVRGEWPGAIAPAARGVSGFGYDPLFVPAGSRLTVAQMSEAAKNTESHRARAARALLERLAGPGLP